MISKVKTANQLGRIAESIAHKFLEQEGLSICEKNYHSRFGEIDIIALDNQILVFIEVRYRQNENLQAVVETIDQHKCKKIIITSQFYINKHQKFRSYQCRYDVITITDNLETPVIKWIKNAFQA